MDRVQLLLGSIIVLVLCLVIILTNNINRNKNSTLLKVLTAISLVSSMYMYSILDQSDLDEIRRISGGEMSEGSDTYLASDLFTQLTTPI